jgi:hypothetical protein
MDTLKRVAQWRHSARPGCVANLLDRPARADPLAGLTERERSVLAVMAEARKLVTVPYSRTRCRSAAGSPISCPAASGSRVAIARAVVGDRRLLHEACQRAQECRVAVVR